MTTDPELPDAPAAPKIPYNSPQLTDIGSVADVTKGAGGGAAADATAPYTPIHS